MDKSKTLELGTKPPGKLLMQYAVPAVIAMIATSLYNMVDRIFIGQGVGPMAISGLAVTFPFMNLASALGAAVGVGSSTLISVSLGRKHYDKAQTIFGNSVMLKIIIGISFSVVCLTFQIPILRLFGATDQTLPYARDYNQIILLGNVFSHLYFGLNAILRSASMPKQAMAATIFTVVLNAILDPIFIYVFHWGIRGAAIATVTSQFTALCWQLYLFSDKRRIVHFQKGIYRLHSRIVRDIFAIGLSPFSMNACACLVVILINNALVRFGGDYAVGAYGIGNSIVFVFLMIVMGVNQGMQPIAGYNFGAKKFKRMMRVVNLSIICATCVTSIGWIICELFPQPVVSLFTTDADLMHQAMRGLRINAILFPIIGYQMVVTNFFQSIGKAKLSIFLSLSRQLIFLIPFILILSRFFGTDGVWAALPCSDGVATIMAAVCMMVYMRKLRNHEEGDECCDVRSYNYYRSSNGATPRGMAPQANGALYEKVDKGLPDGLAEGD
ncbi:MAG: MATE family efflux transporter [Prevotella sp.]|nr:MATE family efflux transporter [Prevotella sp.]